MLRQESGNLEEKHPQSVEEEQKPPEPMEDECLGCNGARHVP